MSLTAVNTQSQPVNFFQTIPEDVFFNIFSRISSLNEIRSLLFTNWSFNKFFSLSDNLWSNFIVSHFKFPLISIPVSVPFKNYYRFLKRVNQNIKTGDYLFDSFPEQKGSVEYMALYKDKCISCSNSRAIKAWDAKTKKELHTFESYRGGSLLSVAVNGNMLIVGYDGGVVECWDLDTYKKLQSFKAHSNAVNCLAVNQDLLITASPREIKFWDLKKNEELHAFATGSEFIVCLAVYENLLIFGSLDGTIGIWDQKNKQGLHSFKAHKGEINALLVKGNTLISCSNDKTVKMWSLDDFEELHTFYGHEGAINGLETFGDYVFSCSNDNTIRVWDLKNKKQLHVFEGPLEFSNQKRVTCLAWIDGALYAGTNGGNFHVYNFNHDEPKVEE
jgi:WD40 repeat protein